MHYKIKLFSKMTDLSIDTLRYYEKEGIIIPQRDKNNYRIYTKADYEWADCVSKLRLSGMPIKEIKKYTHLQDGGAKTIPDKLLLLAKQLEVMLEQQQKINEYISFLKDRIAYLSNQ